MDPKPMSRGLWTLELLFGRLFAHICIHIDHNKGHLLSMKNTLVQTLTDAKTGCKSKIKLNSQKAV